MDGEQDLPQTYVPLLTLSDAHHLPLQIRILQLKDGKEKKDGKYRHQQPANRAGCQREPKGFLFFGQQERKETQHRGEDGQEYRHHLRVPCLDKSPERR